MLRYTLLLACFLTGVMGCQRMLTRRDPDNLPPPAAAPSQPSVGSARSTAPDDRKPLRERLEERRQERKEAREKAEKDPPRLPSALAPKDAIARAEAPRPLPEAASTPAASENASDLAAIRKLYQVAAGRFEKLIDFEARLVRQEVVKGVQGPKEELFFQYRKQPLSIYMKSIVESGRPREVLYVQGKFDNKMHVLIGDADANFLMKSGSLQKFDPDNPLVASRSRKRIYEAGFGDALKKFGRFIEATASGQRPDGIRYLGMVNRKEYPYPLEAIEATLLPGDDPHLPRGGKKSAFFDMKPESSGYGIPVIISTCDHEGREVEYYCFDRFRIPANLTDQDFHPDRLGKK